MEYLLQTSSSDLSSQSSWSSQTQALGIHWPDLDLHAHSSGPHVLSTVKNTREVGCLRSRNGNTISFQTIVREFVEEWWEWLTTQIWAFITFILTIRFAITLPPWGYASTISTTKFSGAAGYILYGSLNGKGKNITS